MSTQGGSSSGSRKDGGHQSGYDADVDKNSKKKKSSPTKKKTKTKDPDNIQSVIKSQRDFDKKHPKHYGSTDFSSGG
ncbi:hypothetical protein MGN70_005912 [Eutypa lata]|uniref:Uncharacterized protein n=1 Tax=Eutypa lata (strain UCR-EL1) TaxID=1287681 RepID=M7T6B0_EUTLA|nr:hypothetical protein UCREL1_10888 [Eutypa lata UCREL1]KAI1251344.1 hypothetical protein MGN70_005912 [Eutypa lata]